MSRSRRQARVAIGRLYKPLGEREHALLFGPGHVGARHHLDEEEGVAPIRLEEGDPSAGIQQARQVLDRSARVGEVVKQEEPDDPVEALAEALRGYLVEIGHARDAAIGGNAKSLSFASELLEGHLGEVDRYDRPTALEQRKREAPEARAHLENPVFRLDAELIHHPPREISSVEVIDPHLQVIVSALVVEASLPGEMLLVTHGRVPSCACMILIIQHGSADLVAGELVTGAEPDWSFLGDVGTIELQLLDPPRSRLIWVADYDGKMYVVSGYMSNPIGRLWKRWPAQAERDGRAVVRIEGKRYERTLVRIRSGADVLEGVSAELGRKYGFGGPGGIESGNVWLFEVGPRTGASM